MSKQDRQGVRTPQDLERKYNLGLLAQGDFAKNTERIGQIEQELTQYKVEVNAKLEEVKESAGKNKQDIESHATDESIHVAEEEKSNLNTAYEHSQLTSGNPHNTSKDDIKLGNVDNTADISKPVSTAQQSAIDKAYANSNAYTDQKIADLINGAPSTLDTLKEIADAMAENEDVVKALDESIGSKASQAELDGHTGNSIIHTTATEKSNWNKAHEHSQETHSIAQGGTGATTAKGAEYNITAGMSEDTYDPTDNVLFAGVYMSPSLTNGRFYYRKASSVWNYIKSKISSVLGLTATEYGGNSASASKVNGHTVEADVPSGAKFTDTNNMVRQARSGASKYRPLLMHYNYANAGEDPNEATNLVYYNESISASPLNGEIKATKFTGDLSGNAESADKATTLEGLTATVDELNFVDGVTGNIQEQLNAKASSSHSHNYLPLSGGTVSGTTNINGLTTRSTSVPDNSGYAKYLLMFDVTTWYNLTSTNSSIKYGFNGFVYSKRDNGYMNESITKVLMGVAYQKVTAEDGQRLCLRTESTAYRPCIVHDATNAKYYLALKCSGSGRVLRLHGMFSGTYVGTWINCKDSSGTMPDGYSVVLDNCKKIAYTAGEVDSLVAKCATKEELENVSAGGISGTIKIENGGTGAATAKGAEFNLHSGMSTATTDITDENTLAFTHLNPNATDGVFYNRKMSFVWKYIQGKIASVLGLTSTSYAGNASTATLAKKAYNDGEGNNLADLKKRLDVYANRRLENISFEYFKSANGGDLKYYTALYITTLTTSYQEITLPNPIERYDELTFMMMDSNAAALDMCTIPVGVYASSNVIILNFSSLDILLESSPFIISLNIHGFPKDALPIIIPSTPV